MVAHCAVRVLTSLGFKLDIVCWHCSRSECALTIPAKRHEAERQAWGGG